MNQHDASYRLLFNNPTLVRSLFEGIIQGPWIELFDWSRLESLPADYVSDRLHRRHGDIIWRLPRRDEGGDCVDPRDGDGESGGDSGGDGHKDDGDDDSGSDGNKGGVSNKSDSGDGRDDSDNIGADRKSHKQDLYLILMLEHQSTNDMHMALRMLTYRGLLYEALLRHKPPKAAGKLPIVLPVVIYSGVPRWSAARNIVDLIDAAPAPLQPYQPQLSYLLIDEGALVQAGGLPDHNLAALLFRLEHNRGIDDVQRLIQKVYNYTKADRTLRRAFTSWARYVLLPRALPDVKIPQVDDLLEIKDMLTDHSRSWTHQWKMEGVKEGQKKGLQEGLKEGQATMLRNQLTRKFGPLPEPIQQRLSNATPNELEAWSLNLLDAASLAEVFSQK